MAGPGGGGTGSPNNESSKGRSKGHTAVVGGGSLKDELEDILERSQLYRLRGVVVN